MKKPTAKLQECIDLLKAVARPVLPVKVEFGKPEGAFADIGVEDGHFLITLDYRHSTELAKHFLVHEWAHAIVWATGPLIRDHGDAWSDVHGRLYRIVFDSE